MYEFWYDDVTRKYGEEAKLCYMDTDCIIVYIKTDDIYMIKTLQKMLKLDQKLQIVNQTDRYLKEKIKRNWINER